MGHGSRWRRRGRRPKKARARRRPPFAKRLLKAAPVLLAATALTFLLSQAGALQHLETVALDTLTRLQKRPKESDVAIVRITDETYREKFRGKSPLDPKQLEEIIRAIAAGTPRLIAIDIDTAPEVFCCSLNLSDIETPVVWGRNAIYSQRKKEFLASVILGGCDSAVPSGLMVLREDEDGVVRRYQRIFPTPNGPFPSFPQAIVKQLREKDASKLPENDSEMLIGFVANTGTPFRVNMPASDVLRSANDPGWQKDSVLKDKIVLLGGDYAVQDEHNTPVGWMLGVEVLAQVVETELRGGGFHPASRIVIAVLQILDGMVLLLLFHFQGLKKAILWGALAIPFLALIGSLIAFRSLGYWVYFVFVLTAVLVHQIYEKLKDYKKELAVEGMETLADATKAKK
jgi:CHASE2 domain-containing sensor protein